MEKQGQHELMLYAPLCSDVGRGYVMNRLYFVRRYALAKQLVLRDVAEAVDSPLMGMEWVAMVNPATRCLSWS